MTVAPNGDVWAGTTEGLSFFDGSAWTTYTEEDGLAGDTVRAIVFDSRGNLWAGSGSDDGGLSVFDGSGWRVYKTDEGLVSNNVRGITLGPDDSLWIATLAGASFFDGRVFTNYTVRGRPCQRLRAEDRSGRRGQDVGSVRLEA